MSEGTQHVPNGRTKTILTDGQATKITAPQLYIYTWSYPLHLFAFTNIINDHI